MERQTLKSTLEMATNIAVLLVYYCANNTPTIGNRAATDGRVGDAFVIGSSVSITIPGFSLRHIFAGYANCNGVSTGPSVSD